MDGVVKRPADSYSRALDIAATLGDDIDPLYGLAAEVEWSQGSVLVSTVRGIDVLVIPCRNLTVTLITTALERAQRGPLPALRCPLPRPLTVPQT